MKTNTKTQAQPVSTTNESDNSSTTQELVDALITAPSSKKPNPSADLIGKKITSDKMISVNYRKGKANVVECSEIEIVSANATGRRLQCIFRDLNGDTVMNRRIYREWLEEAESKFNK